MIPNEDQIEENKEASEVPTDKMKQDEEPESEAIDIAPYLYPLASFLLPFVVYWRTMCPALYIGDAGDFITASYTLGVPHPPGYPLYTLLGKLFLLLPIPGGIGWAAWRMNFMSALLGAITTLLVYFFITKLTKRQWLGFFAALTIGFGRTFWSQAVITEVYTLNTFFILIQLYLLHVRVMTLSPKSLVWFGLMLGLSLTHHPSICIFFPAYVYYSSVHRDHATSRLLLIALAIGLAIINPYAIVAILLLIPYEIFVAKKYQTDASSKTNKGFALALVLFLISLLLYAYLPIAGYKNPVTGPMKFESTKENIAYFIETVTRSIYQYKALSPGEQLTTTSMVIMRYFQIMWDDYLALIFILIPGLFAIWRKSRMAWTLLASYILFMIVILFYPSGDILRAPLNNLDVVMPPLMIPAQIMFILFGFLGVGYILDWMPSYVESMREVDPMPPALKERILNGVAIGSIGILSIVLIPAHNWFFCDKSRDLVAYNYARNVMTSAPENSFILNTGDETFLFWYMQEVEKFLPEKNLIFENWIHNIRDFSVLTNEEQAIHEVLLWVLKNREWGDTDPEFKIPDHRLPEPDHRDPGIKHWCSTFLTDFIQKDAAFVSQDAIMHGLVYEFAYKPVEYYEKYNYGVSDKYGIIKVEKTPSSDGKEPNVQSLEERRETQPYFEDDYPGMRLIVEGDIPYDTFYWEGLFIPQRDSNNKVTGLEYDMSYKDPQEEEVIGRYQEMFHNIGAWNIYKAKNIEGDEKIKILMSATAAFQDEIKLKPSDPAGWLALGNAYLQMRMIREAIKSLSEHVAWTERDPNSTMEMRAESHYYLALAYYIAGDFNNSLKEIDSSLLMYSSNTKFADLREEILTQRDATQKKIERLKGALEKMDEKELIDDGKESKELDLDKSIPETGAGDTQKPQGK